MLNDLPIEILYEICRYLNVETLKILPLLCHRLNNLLKNTDFWVHLMRLKWEFQGNLLVNSNDGSYSSKNIFLNCQRKIDIWRNMKEFYNDKYSGVVDCCCLFNSHNGGKLVSGCRDKTLRIFDLEKLPGNVPYLNNVQISSRMNAHTGWIWCLQENNNLLASGGWDAKLKVWDVDNLTEPVQVFKAQTSILSVKHLENTIVAGSFNKLIYDYDKRSNTSINYLIHNKPILAIDTCLDNNYILSCSEDGKLNVFDRRNRQILKSHTFKTYPTCLSVASDILFVGDSIGQLHLFKDFNLIDSFQAHRFRIVNVFYQNVVYTASNDVKMWIPSTKPKLMFTTKDYGYNQICRMDVMDNILALALCDNGLRVWKNCSL